MSFLKQSFIISSLSALKQGALLLFFYSALQCMKDIKCILLNALRENVDLNVVALKY